MSVHHLALYQTRNRNSLCAPILGGHDAAIQHLQELGTLLDIQWPEHSSLYLLACRLLTDFTSSSGLVAGFGNPSLRRG